MKRLVETYKELFGDQPKEVHSPLDKDDKPELDESPLLGPDGIKCYQTLTGAAQWLITLSRFDIAHAIMSLGQFRAAPRERHLERLKRVIGYVQKRSHCAIRFRTGIPNYEEQFFLLRCEFDARCSYGEIRQWYSGVYQPDAY